MKTIRVGNGAGFWGDNLDAPRRLCEGAQLDYLTLEYLAELTMSILAHQKSRNPAAGWVTDFEIVLRGGHLARARGSRPRGRADRHCHRGRSLAAAGRTDPRGRNAGPPRDGRSDRRGPQ